MDKISISDLQKKAHEFRKQILEMIYRAGSGHPGGSLSCIDILTCLYYYRMNHDPKNPKWDGRDRFIMSKGHASPALDVVLAGCGYFPEQELFKFRKMGALLQGHVHAGTPGVELSTGSLGQGLSVANGMALAGKLTHSNYKVYCLIGDGEIQEGQIWESIMTSAQHKLNNLCVILDCNRVQENGFVSDIKTEEPIIEKLSSFGWSTIEIDGHDINPIINALGQVGTTARPLFIKANTIKGKGVSFMENNSNWHGKAPNKQEYELAMEQITTETRNKGNTENWNLK